MDLAKGQIINPMYYPPMRKTAKIIKLNCKHSTMLSSYKKYISDLANNNQDELFFNSGKEHAIVVLSTILNKAKNHVKIYAGNLNGGIANSPAYQDAMRQFLAREGKVTVLLEEYNPANKPEIFQVFKLYKKLFPNNVELKTHNQIITEGGKQYNPIHFCVADGKMYRIERDVVNFAAQGNFNDSNVAGELEEVFDRINNAPTTHSIVNL